MPESRPTWLVTGARGFLGANLGAFLADHVHRIGVARSSSDATALYDEMVAGDLTDPTGLAATIERLRPDVVVHAGALASHEACERDPDLAERVNVLATGTLAGACERSGSRLVYLSTDAVFDGSSGHYAETDPTSPTSVYGRTKLRGEEEAADIDALIVRTNFFGWSPGGQRSILEFFVNELSAGHRVRGFTDFTTTSAYAPVLAETLWQLVAADSSGLFHVTSPDALTKHGFGVAVAEAFGLDAELITPTTSDMEPPRGRDISLDVSKVEDILGLQLPTQVDGIARAHADAATLRLAVQGGREA